MCVCALLHSSLGAYFRNRLLYVAIGDVGAEIWDVVSLKRRRTVRYGQQHDHVLCEFSMPIQVGSHVYIFHEGKTAHRRINLDTEEAKVRHSALLNNSAPPAVVFV